MSYVKNSAGVLQVMDSNDYYPFGMSHLKNTQSVYDPMTIPYNYKYNGKELQETGMYDYGARFYMPDIGRFGQYDPLAEKTMEPYAYVYNNPVMMIDPTGMEGESSDAGDMQTGVDGDVSLAFGVRASDVQKVSGMGGMNSYNYGDSTGTKAASKKTDTSNPAVHEAGVAAAGDHSVSCPTCPDNKENITFGQAYSNAMGKGETMYQDITSLGLSVKQSDFNSKGFAEIKMDSPSNMLKFREKALVHGTIRLERLPGNPNYAQVRMDPVTQCRCGMYDFEIQNYKGSEYRDAFTALAGILHIRNPSAILNGGIMYGAKPFLIQYTNTIKIK